MTTEEPLAGSNITTVTTPTTARPAALRRRSRAAVARSAAGNRSLALLIGLALLAVGTLVVLLSYGVFGTARANRPLLDPVVVDTLRTNPPVVRIVAIAAGVLLALLGLVWAARSLRPERHPDLVLDSGPDTTIVVSSSAVAETVGEQAGTLPGVGRARARLVGRDAAPALRVTLWLADDADVADVLRRLEEQVIASALTSLGLDAIPVAVRLELESATDGSRVA